jgi:hypothetical protein
MDAINGTSAPHMGSSATGGTAHCQGFGFDKIANHHANIIGLAGRQV